MSARTAAFALFALAVFTVPFPLFGLQGSFVPVARYAQLVAVLLALIAQEGAGGMVGLFAALLAGHVVVYTALLGLAAWLLRRFVLEQFSARGRSVAVGACGVVLLASASLAPIYDSGFHYASAHAPLWQLYW